MSDIKISPVHELTLKDQFFHNVTQSLDNSLFELSNQILEINPDHDFWGFKNQRTIDIIEEKGLYFVFCLRKQMSDWLKENSSLVKD